MNSDLEVLRSTERECINKFNARAAKLMAADNRLPIEVARGKAIEQMPNTAARYSAARQRLSAALIRPLRFDEV